MANFNPSRWQDFPINKEIKRIKEENSRTIWNKIQLLSSIIVVCITIILEGLVSAETRAYIAGGLCFILLLVFVVPLIIYAIKDGKLAIKKYKPDELIKIFDEDIIYNTIISYEFFKEKSVPGIDSNIIEFYNIEQGYYFEKVIIDLKKVYYNKEDLIKSGKLTDKRFDNVKRILCIIINDKQMHISEDIETKAEDMGIKKI